MPVIEPWSILWYVGSFGGLILFFFLVSCSEWCCRKYARSTREQERNNSSRASPSPTLETPPPAYDLFAPPSYESLDCCGEKGMFDVYVVPVHAISSLNNTNEVRSTTPPPSYSSFSVANLPNQSVNNSLQTRREYCAVMRQCESSTQT